MNPFRKTLNLLAAATGIVIVSDRLPRPRDPRRESALDLRGYRQVEDFSCGFAAALMVLDYLEAAPSIDRLYELVDPHPMWGTSTRKLSTALRRCGIRVSIRDELDFDGIAKAIASQQPVITCIDAASGNDSHWAIVYGVGIRPRRLYLGGVGLPHLHAGKVISWRAFRSMWTPVGNGIVCSRPSRRQRP